MVKDANNMIYYVILKTIYVLYYVDFCNFTFINCEYQIMIVMFYRNLVHERERERERESTIHWNPPHLPYVTLITKGSARTNNPGKAGAGGVI